MNLIQILTAFHSLHQIESQGVHGRMLACHARGTGSLPVGTANLYSLEAFMVMHWLCNPVNSVQVRAGEPVAVV